MRADRPVFPAGPAFLSPVLMIGGFILSGQQKNAPTFFASLFSQLVFL
jgi:hypothetical protein